ncbi:MAG: hypothetical protein AB1798_02135 [Spirochaetota bacterium]
MRSWIKELEEMEEELINLYRVLYDNQTRQNERIVSGYEYQVIIEVLKKMQLLIDRHLSGLPSKEDTALRYELRLRLPFFSHLAGVYRSELEHQNQT